MVDSTRCKLVVNKLEMQPGNGVIATLTAVYDSNPESENGKFFHYTPVAEVRLGILNPNVRDFFELGKEYFVDFSRAPEKDAE